MKIVLHRLGTSGMNPTGKEAWDGEWVVYDKDSAMRLRAPECRVVGRFTGTIPQHPSQNTHLVLPMVVSGEAGRLLIRKGLAVDVDGPTPVSSKIAHGEKGEEEASCSKRDACFERLWSNGLYITDGTKFGAHWIAYEGDPLTFHATFATEVMEKPVQLSQLVSFTRVCHTAKKVPLIAEDESTFVTLEWVNFN